MASSITIHNILIIQLYSNVKFFPQSFQSNVRPPIIITAYAANIISNLITIITTTLPITKRSFDGCSLLYDPISIATTNSQTILMLQTTTSLPSSFRTGDKVHKLFVAKRRMVTRIVYFQNQSDKKSKDILKCNTSTMNSRIVLRVGTKPDLKYYHSANNAF